MGKMPDRRETKGCTTETKILKAAEAEFMMKGYVGARTTAIAEAAGVTHAMLHYYYRSKEKLFEKFILDKLSMLTNAFLVSFDPERPLMDGIRNAVENHFELVRANPWLPRFMVCEVFTNPTLMDLMADKILPITGQAALALQKRINEGAEKGECKPVNVTSIFMDIISLNVFPILAMPMIRRLGENLPDIDMDNAFETRREDNVQTILRKLMP